MLSKFIRSITVKSFKYFFSIFFLKTLSFIYNFYGNLFIIWDRIFGTFEPEDEPVKFGLVRNVNTFNPTKITFMGWNKIFLDMKKASSLRQAINHFFGPPTTHEKEALN